MPKYVVSSTLKDPTWSNTTVLDGELADAVTQLKDRVDGDILVAGSNELVHGLLADDLIDELRLMVFPVVLGSGKRLFPDAEKAASFHLAECNVVGDGVLTLVYWPKAE
jgi:dihydrofolate reductase